jgi:hypothetical protein
MTSKIDPRLFRAAALSLAVLSAGPASAKGFTSLFKRDKTPVVLQSRAYSVPKAGEEASKNQDAHAADVVSGRFAVGDGVSRSAHPREWSTVLTEGFVKAGLDPSKLVDSLGPLRALWKKKVDDKLDAKAKANGTAHQAAVVTHPEPAIQQQPAKPALSIFDDFANDFAPVAQHQHVEAPKSAGDELLAGLGDNPRLKKSAPKQQVAPQVAPASIGEDLLAFIGKEKTEEKGASSTLLGLEVKSSADGKAKWVSTGLRDADGKFSDSVLFQVRKRKGVVGWVAANVLRKGKMKTVDHWPPLDGDDFDSAPAQLRTKTDADGLVHMVTKEGTAKKGDQFLLTTDAVGKWIMSAKGRHRSERIQKLIETKDQAGFAKLIDAERENGMTNDDSTVMVVDVK